MVREDSRSAVSVPHVGFSFRRDSAASNPMPEIPRPATVTPWEVWVPDGDSIKGRIVEITADRTTRQFVSRDEISFSVRVNRDTLSGVATAIFHDIDGRPVTEPHPATLEGQRILP